MFPTNGSPQFKIKENFDQSSSLVLFEGDCRNLLKQIPSGTVTLIVTWPPYNIGKPYERLRCSPETGQGHKVVVG